MFLLAFAAFAAPATTFREFELGGPCPSGPEWSLYAETQDAQSWTRTGEKLAIGDAHLSAVEWICWPAVSPPILVSVTLHIVSGAGPTMRDTLTAQWGAPFRSNPYIDRYLWAGPVLGFLDYASNESVVLIVHKASQARVEAAMRQRAADAGGDL